MSRQLQISKKLFNDIYFPCLFDYSHRYNVFYGGAGSGKSHYVFQAAVIKALSMRRKILVVRKVAKTNLNSTFQMTIDTLRRFQILNQCSVNKTTLSITLPNNSMFIYLGCDDSEKLKSIAGITDIICEEATELTLDDFTQLDLRLRPREPFPQIWVMLNPTSKASWIYKRWFEPGVEINNENTFILKTTYKNNRFLPSDYVSSLLELAKINPTYYKIYVEGEFCSLDKLVYTNWEVREFDPTEIKGQLVCGLDWGFSADPTAFTAAILDEPNKTIYVFQEWYERGKTNPEIAEAIKQLGFAKSIIICDSAEPKSCEEIRRLGLVRAKASVKGPDSLRAGIQKLQQYKLVIHPSCPNIQTELENYSWTKKDGEYINVPCDNFNHLLDSLRYSLQSADKGLVRVVDKTALGI